MNFGDMMEMLRNPQAMQARMLELREKTSRIRASGSAGGGMVKITLSGDLEMVGCEIAAEATSDVALLQDLVRAAYTDAATKVKEAVQTELASGMGDLPLPPGMFGGV